jgi:hypothetical protein
MKLSYVPLIVASAVGLGACTYQVPSVAPREPTTMYKLWVAQQWDQAAGDIAQRLVAGLSAVYPRGQPRILYVERPANPSQFTDTFRQLLITKLMAQGFGVSDNPNEGLPVAINAELITRDTFTQPPYSELVLNVSVMSGNRYLSRVSDIYYVSSYDLDNYLAQATTARTLEVVGQ